MSIKENNKKRETHLETIVSNNKVRKEKRKKKDRSGNYGSDERDAQRKTTLHLLAFFTKLKQLSAFISLSR